MKASDTVSPDFEWMWNVLLHCMLRATKGSDVYRALNERCTNFYRKWELAKEKAVEISEREAPPDILTTRTISRFEGAIDIMPTCSTIAKELRQSLAGVAKKLIKTFNPADVGIGKCPFLGGVHLQRKRPQVPRPRGIC